MSQAIEKRNACRQINNFRGLLAEKYSKNDYFKLSAALDDMRERYGDVFVAAAIRKDPKDAELALFRYWRKYCQPVEEEPIVQSAQRMHKVPPHENRRSIAKTFAALITIILLVVIAATYAASVDAVDRSNQIIAEADRILEAD